MKLSRDLCILFLWVSAFTAGISGTVIKLLDLDKNGCNQGNTSHPLYMSEHPNHEIRWEGSQLPQSCDVVFRWRNYLEKKEDFLMCVRSLKYNVSDCDFRLKLFNSKSEKVSSCGTQEINFCIDNDQDLNIQFHVTNVTGNNHVVLVVNAKPEGMDHQMIGVIVGAVIGGIIIIIVIVIVVIKCKKRDNGKEEYLDDTALHPYKD